MPRRFEIGQLISDLQRRNLEGQGLYDVLLRISNHKPLAETLEALVSHGQNLLDADAAELSLTAASTALLDGTVDALVKRRADGSACISAPPRTPANGSAGVAAKDALTTTSGAADDRTLLRVSLVTPELALGELWVARQQGAPFSEREARFLQSLGELGGIAITSARMREREHQMAVLAERERIAREMHDSLAQVLGFIHIELRALRGKATQVDPAIVAARLAELAGVAEDAYRDVREAILGLRESSRAGRSLFENLDSYLQRYEHQAGIDTTFETDFEQPPSLSPQAEIHVIRVIQEALTNVRKHAHARRAVVRATNVDGSVEFTVEDDGNGFDLANAALGHDGGFGLAAMRERMELVGGTLTIDSKPKKGTRVIARVPLAPAGTAAVDGAASGAAV